ncbi:transcriptional regulator [Prauserella marina]|uniref:DNA-binding transcriptional regulator, MurR/RpiR family, contains HTH and SIS domains n=1 Tax=Prauserella marina TaxID=530584 RepID=A0A222VSN3_9PSEU|nr:MurR/RpiR family transcriptional regulator [Prauserella marina]ASR36743.1 transcriptional regulator [Prauserella marina]PWV80370.1 RpiR family transcriptional regulator [Prauserella marina]SDD52857.1 DNA-binding transcriptional regulator, MurR/RpiR family, contains HTH and SIS domains [Prauserella marina]
MTSASERLLSLFEGRRLSPAQRRIAQFLLDHVAEAAFLSSVALAERAGVSQPSVTRFATALGFAGYPELRDALRPIALGAIQETEEDVRRNEFQAAVDAELGNLQALRAMLADPLPLVRLGKDLASSLPLAVMGLRVSAALARYFAFAAHRIHPDVRLITEGGSAAHEGVLHTKQAGGRWLLAFVLPRYAGEALDTLRTAKELGLRTAVITDVPLVMFGELADVLLAAGVSVRPVFDSHAAPMTLAAVILQAMADAEPGRTQRRLEEHDSISQRRGFFATG